MFFFARVHAGSGWMTPERGASSLGLFAGHAADSCRVDDDLFAELPGLRAPVRRGWRVQRSPSSWPVLLHGVIDNLAQLAQELGVAPSPELVYGAAVERWGNRADARIVGYYAALTVLPDGTVRLARSAWVGNPLFYHQSPDGLMVCSIPRPLFAAGLPRRLHPGVMESLITMEKPPCGPTLYQGLDQVAGGTVTLLGRNTVQTESFYDPAEIAPVNFRDDRDYVEAASAMLTEASAAMLRMAKRPGVTLSGGLDSALICDEMLRQVGPGGQLRAYTFVPIKEWDGSTAPHMFGSDQPYVDQFLASHPGLIHRYVDNRDIDPLTRNEERLLAGDSFNAGNAIAFPHLGVVQAAQADGCDWLFSGWMGNMTLSSEAPWAMAEFFRTLRWGEAWRLARGNLNDSRPMWRRFLAAGLMPNLPRGVADFVRDRLRPGEHRNLVANPYVDPTGPLAARRDDRSLRDNSWELDWFHSRERFIASLYQDGQYGGESGLAVQQMTGLPGRDVYGYRPLIELFLGMPTGQFIRKGERRFLARRLAIGRLPEAQRTERRHGDHVTDWHVRMTMRLPALRAELDALAAHPDLAGLLDVAAMRRDLDNWPTQAPTDMDTINRLRFHLPAMFGLRRYLDFVSGRNAS